MKRAVIHIAGIGAKTEAYLKEQGIDSIEALLAAGVAVLANAPGFGENRARQVMEAASAQLLAEVQTEPKTAGKKENKKKRKGHTKKKDKTGDKEKKSGKKKGKKKGKGKKKKKEKKK